MEMTGLQIFKYTPSAKKLPESNCKKCGCPTCMAFSLKLAKQQININKCPYLSQEFREKYLQNIKHAQKTIYIGDLKIGGENVLYRHEKTFINPTAIAITVDCSNSDCQEKIEQISQFGVNILNKIVGVDLIILKNSTKEFSLPSNSIKCLTEEEFYNIGLDIKEEKDFEQTKNYLIKTREKAIREKDESCSNPVCIIMKNDNIYSQCSKASYYICKYANMLVFQKFNKYILSPLLTLRQNIFTDPQQTLQVEPGLYKFNEPDENSIIFLTTNFALTFFAVSNELESLSIPSYLIVIPAQGMSVLTAWSAETFNPEIVSKTISDLNIKQNIKTRKIIIPGLLSDITTELHNACPDFEFIEGTHEASDIADFVSKLI